MPVGGIRIIGMEDFQAGVRHLEGTDLAKSLIPYFSEFAADVAARGRSKANTPQMARAATSIVASGQTISLGGGEVWYMGALFGSDEYHQFPPFRHGGYTIYPAMHEIGGEYLTKYEKAIEEICTRAAFH